MNRHLFDGEINAMRRRLNIGGVLMLALWVSSGEAQEATNMREISLETLEDKIRGGLAYRVDRCQAHFIRFR